MTIVGPAHLAQIPVQIVFMKVKPVFTCNSVTDGVASLRMQDHLGVADGAGGKVDEAGVVAVSL
jgi:hypothetical protein